MLPPGLYYKYYLTPSDEIKAKYTPQQIGILFRKAAANNNLELIDFSMNDNFSAKSENDALVKKVSLISGIDVFKWSSYVISDNSKENKDDGSGFWILAAILYLGNKLFSKD